MTELATIASEPKRDRFGRPRIKRPDGSEVYYTRTTTLVGAFEDTFKISLWSQRHAARGVALHGDLIAAVKDASPEDRDTLNGLVEEAKERSGANDSSRHGTYLHAVTEAYDRGQDPSQVARPLQSYGYIEDRAYEPDLAAYAAATVDLKHVCIEQMTVHDEWKVAGTPDRVVEYLGKRYIADLKSGDITYGAGKIAAQLAMYSRGLLYDHATNTRSEHGADQGRGIVIHLPAGSGTCTLHWIDLNAGWEIAQVCKRVREIRNIGNGQVFKPFGGPTDVTLNQALASERPPLMDRVASAQAAAERIKVAMTREELNAIWAEHKDAWTETLSDLGRQRLVEVGVA